MFIHLGFNLSFVLLFRRCVLSFSCKHCKWLSCKLQLFKFLKAVVLGLIVSLRVWGTKMSQLEFLIVMSFTNLYLPTHLLMYLPTPPLHTHTYLFESSCFGFNHLRVWGTKISQLEFWLWCHLQISTYLPTHLSTNLPTYTPSCTSTYLHTCLHTHLPTYTQDISGEFWAKS